MLVIIKLFLYDVKHVVTSV